MERGEGSPSKADVCSGFAGQSPRATLQPRKLSGLGSLPSRWTWERSEPRGPRWGCCKDQSPLPTPTPKPISQPVTKAPKLPQVTSTDKKAKPGKAEPKTTSAPKKAAVKLKKAASADAKPVATPKPIANQPSPLEDISDLLDSLPLETCVQLTRWLLASISSLPKAAARPPENRHTLRH